MLLIYFGFDSFFQFKICFFFTLHSFTPNQEWEHNKHENIITFRDCPHRSVMTGTMAPVHHTPWLTAYDDSIESYVDGNKPAPGKQIRARL